MAMAAVDSNENYKNPFSNSMDSTDKTFFAINFFLIYNNSEEIHMIVLKQKTK